jgi:argininosuccinate synthase
MSKGKVCVAFSGGLDTSVILKWLIDEGYEVVAFTADVGQEGNSSMRDSNWYDLVRF